MFLGQIFVKNAQNDPRILFERSKSEKMKIGENAEMLVNSVKSGLFWSFKRQNSAAFQDINLKFCTHIHQQVFFHIYSGF